LFVLKIVIGLLAGTVNVIVDVEKALTISLDVEQIVHVDPLHQNNPLIIVVNKFLEKYRRNAVLKEEFNDCKINIIVFPL